MNKYPWVKPKCIPENYNSITTTLLIGKNCGIGVYYENKNSNTVTNERNSIKKMDKNKNN